jgi:hypothetical protein
LQPQQQQQKMVDGYFLCFITAKKTQEEDEGECCRRLLYALLQPRTKRALKGCTSTSKKIEANTKLK